MASIFAIISKAMFEADAPAAAVGELLPLASYASRNKALDPVADRGSLFLVTVRPPDDRLWLVAILERPKLARDRWVAAANKTPITDITRLIGRLVFETGTGIKAKPGALGMALQAPRRLTSEDVALLRGAVLGTAETALSLPRIAAALDDGQTEMAPVAMRAVQRPFAKARRSEPRILPVPSTAPTGPPAMSLGDVVVELEAERVLAALEIALAVWRALSTVEVAELIEHIGAQVDRSMPPLVGEGHDVHGEWLAVASQRRAADVGRLMARLADGTLAMLSKRFQLLASFAPDPRIALAPLELVAGYTSVGAEPAYTAALALAIKMADGRAAPLIGKLVRKAPGFLIAGEAGDLILPITSLIGLMLLWLSALLTLYTGWDYFRAGVRHLIED